jgi:hypothetical protein
MTTLVLIRARKPNFHNKSATCADIHGYWFAGYLSPGTGAIMVKLSVFEKLL